MMPRQWKLEKYARFIQNTPGKENVCLQKVKENGTWQHFSQIPSNPIILTIEEPSNLIIRQGGEVFESFTLLQAAKWCKVIARNESMLFFYKNKDSVRRFRIKFTSLSNTISSTQNCIDFVNALQPFVHVEVTDDAKSAQTNSTLESSQILSQTQSQFNANVSSTITKSDSSLGKLSVAGVARSVISNDTSSLPSYFQSGNLHVEDSSAAILIKTCILDPNFPSFVDEVERHIFSMIDTS